MVRDAVANVVERLRENGFEPRKVGSDSWEARCPAHRSADHALAITRDPFDQVVLECRSAHRCQHFPIIGALGITNDHVYAETPESLLAELGRVPIEPASFPVASVTGRDARELKMGEKPSSATNAGDFAASPRTSFRRGAGDEWFRCAGRRRRRGGCFGRQGTSE